MKMMGKGIRSRKVFLSVIIKIKIVLDSGENKQKITKKSNISPEVDKKAQFKGSPFTRC